MQGLRNLGVERFVALVLIVLAVVELFAIWKLPLGAEFTLGPGAMPLIYAVGLLLFATVLFLRTDRRKADADDTSTDFKSGILFFVLLVAFAVCIELAGFLIATAGFSILSLLLVARLEPLKSVLFAAAWSGGLFYVFKYVLQVPLEPGLLFS